MFSPLPSQREMPGIQVSSIGTLTSGRYETLMTYLGLEQIWTPPNPSRCAVRVG